MLLQTKYFGTLECEEEKALHFPKGIFGFEEEKRFFLLPFEGSGGSLLCFQSVSTPALAFTAMNPFFLRPDYAPVLSPEELQEMGVGRSEDLCFYTLCVVKNPVSASTVNLRCPVVINDETRQAMQVILDGDAYHMHHPLSEFARRRGEEAVC